MNILSREHKLYARSISFSQQHTDLYMFWKGKQEGKNKSFYSALSVHKVLDKFPKVALLH